MLSHNDAELPVRNLVGVPVFRCSRKAVEISFFRMEVGAHSPCRSFVMLNLNDVMDTDLLQPAIKQGLGIT